MNIEIIEYPQKPYIIASSMCLIGINCRYDGKSNEIELLTKLNKAGYLILIPFCPEIFGGLSTPRIPAEITKYDKNNIYNSIVLNKNGDDVSANFIRGAEESLKLLSYYKIDLVILKSNSPSCGYEKIYDGSFSRKIVDGNGITTTFLINSGYKIISSDNIPIQSGYYSGCFEFVSEFVPPISTSDFLEESLKKNKPPTQNGFYRIIN